jgi:hypothetical protein
MIESLTASVQKIEQSNIKIEARLLHQEQFNVLSMTKFEQLMRSNALTMTMLQQLIQSNGLVNTIVQPGIQSASTTNGNISEIPTNHSDKDTSQNIQSSMNSESKIVVQKCQYYFLI